MDRAVPRPGQGRGRVALADCAERTFGGLWASSSAAVLAYHFAATSGSRAVSDSCASDSSPCAASINCRVSSAARANAAASPALDAFFEPPQRRHKAAAQDVARAVRLRRERFERIRELLDGGRARPGAGVPRTAVRRRRRRGRPARRPAPRRAGARDRASRRRRAAPAPPARPPRARAQRLLGRRKLLRHRGQRLLRGEHRRRRPPPPVRVGRGRRVAGGRRRETATPGGPRADRLGDVARCPASPSTLRARPRPFPRPSAAGSHRDGRSSVPAGRCVRFPGDVPRVHAVGATATAGVVGNDAIGIATSRSWAAAGGNRSRGSRGSRRSATSWQANDARALVDSAGAGRGASWRGERLGESRVEFRGRRVITRRGLGAGTEASASMLCCRAARPEDGIPHPRAQMKQGDSRLLCPVRASSNTSAGLVARGPRLTRVPVAAR